MRRRRGHAASAAEGGVGVDGGALFTADDDVDALVGHAGTHGHPVLHRRAENRPGHHQDAAQDHRDQQPRVRPEVRIS
ncbi:hypothetical protein ACFSSF_15365 [Dietzia aerolata]|uniref:hypothetical protein n=1 Tax=Dietzia aerolata TaxID=595984 RepID=UPI0036286CF9